MEHTLSTVFPAISRVFINTMCAYSYGSMLTQYCATIVRHTRSMPNDYDDICFPLWFLMAFVIHLSSFCLSSIVFYLSSSLFRLLAQTFASLVGLSLLYSQTSPLQICQHTLMLVHRSLTLLVAELSMLTYRF